MTIFKHKDFPAMSSMTVKDIRTYLKTSQSIIIPVGITEQHGYHLPLCTDALIAERLSLKIGKELSMLVAPTFTQSYSGGGLPGTINISPAVMSLVMADMLTSLANQGFKNFYLLIGHGGTENTQALDNALKNILRSNPAFNDSLIAKFDFCDLDDSENGWPKAEQEKDWHAGWYETSLMLALAPGLVRMHEMELDTPDLLKMQMANPDNYQIAIKIVEDDSVIPHTNQNPEIKVGVMGLPQKATRKIGQEIVERITDNVSSQISRMEKSL